MTDEIVNRVAKSKLMTIDLEDYYPEGDRVILDIKDWLFEGQILRENEFRTYVKNFDWQFYRNKYVAIICSTDAIIPSWAYLLISIYLKPYAKLFVVGDLELLETVIFTEIVKNLATKQFEKKPVIIKGCSKKYIPQTAYTLLISKLIPVAKSVMYGEACSSVPLYKEKEK